MVRDYGRISVIVVIGINIVVVIAIFFDDLCSVGCCLGVVFCIDLEWLRVIMLRVMTAALSWRRKGG